MFELNIHTDGFSLQGLVNVALDILSRIHTIPTVPIVDCFQKIRQQVKCYLQLAGVMGKNECMQVRSGQLLMSCTCNLHITSNSSAQKCGSGTGLQSHHQTLTIRWESVQRIYIYIFLLSLKAC